jgi:hypothetical protein
MDGVDIFRTLAFGKIYSTSFFVRTANEASGWQRIGASKEIIDLEQGFKSNKASCKSMHCNAPHYRPPCNARFRPPDDGRPGLRAFRSDGRGNQDCGRRIEAMNSALVAQLIRSISQLSLKPGEEEIKKKGWWQFWK